MAASDGRVEVFLSRRTPRSPAATHKSRSDMDPLVVEIVARARTLSAQEIWRLGLALRQLDYSRRTLEIAARRSGRLFEARQLQSEVIEAVHAAACDAKAEVPLALFGLLFDASIATANAALAALLADRLSVERADALRSPWRAVAATDSTPR